MSTKWRERGDVRTADRAAEALVDAVARLVRVTPAGWHAEYGNVVGLVGGSAVASLNAVTSSAVKPDLAALDELASAVAACGLPWSILVREDAGDEVAVLAGRHGLAACSEVPLMVCAASDAVLRFDERQGVLVRRVDSSWSGAYTDALTAGFDVPEGTFGALMGGSVLDAPGFAGYLADGPQGPVGTGLGVGGDEMIGVFNIAVDPRRRGHGLGRALTARVLADGFAAGLGAAYLQPSADGMSLYESMGFRVVETWTMFTANA
ncbi:hypothetical protein GCM10010435_26190 [Winogradskya consettensis]|uniref:N-acetyltransferase domain-containing protein n=1 Tax=Winogradskya consettensis TaxID=113560 RepID=A0A919SAC8_9ACTN|nr:GNAT family N-acetyltransferase [Actinoplanes consettensis]GIM68044.1 hypothetical protein Aco04nite_08980 [Actinoplanes consettensis]